MSDADRLHEERTRVSAIVKALSGEFGGIVAAADLCATDDEHDPEGSTIAFERQRVAALLRDARVKLRSVDDALTRVAVGDYGTCASCRRPIGEERLAALPATRSCIACAGAVTPTVRSFESGGPQHESARPGPPSPRSRRSSQG